jgi:hypothetical protein
MSVSTCKLSHFDQDWNVQASQHYQIEGVLYLPHGQITRHLLLLPVASATIHEMC